MKTLSRSKGKGGWIVNKPQTHHVFPNTEKELKKLDIGFYHEFTFMAFNDGEYSWSTPTPKFTQLADSPLNASCDTKINEN